MQSGHSHSAVSVISTVVVWIVTIAVFVWIVVAVVRSPEGPLARSAGSSIASSTARLASSTSQIVSPLGLAAATSTAIVAPGGSIRAEIAATEDARTQGLSGRAELPTDSGMLFVFPLPGIYGFWMKDMRFPLDMVWIGPDKKVVGVVYGAQPSSYPSIFDPTAPISYVLELDSGDAARYRIATGTQLVF